MWTFKQGHLIKAAYRFRGSIHYHQGRKHGSIQAGMAWEELSSISCSKRNQKTTSRQLGGSENPRPQWHTSLNKATPTLPRPHLPVVPLPGQSIQTITTGVFSPKAFELTLMGLDLGLLSYYWHSICVWFVPILKRSIQSDECLESHLNFPVSGWIDDCLRAYCSCRGPEFHSQHPHWGIYTFFHSLLELMSASA